MDVFLFTIKILPGIKLKCYFSYCFNKQKLQAFYKLTINNFKTIKMFRILTPTIKILLISFCISTYWFLKYLITVLKLFH